MTDGRPGAHDHHHDQDQARSGAVEALERLLDPASFRCWDDARPSHAATADDDYAGQLRQARLRTGLDEAVVAGTGRLRGRRVAVLASEFAFLGGSIGRVAAARIVDALDRAADERLPLVVLPASGGTRMQEGTPAFVQMAVISAAVQRYKATGLAYIVYLRNPTTGGVLASWASLGHVTFAEPGALVGLLGPRVQQAVAGRTLPPDVQTADNLYQHGVVDAVVPLDRLAEVVARTLAVLAPDGPAQRPRRAGPAEHHSDAGLDLPGRNGFLGHAPARDAAGTWDSITRTRRADRPGARDVLDAAATEVTFLATPGSPTRVDGRALLLALARFAGQPAVVVAQDRLAQQSWEPLGPEHFRTVHRGLKLADELALPVVTLIDTPGAALSRAAEEGGLAAEIARCLAAMVTVASPTVSVLLGQGCGAAALALLPADRVLAVQHAWLGALSPEGASMIVHRTGERAAAMAESQAVASAQLRRSGIVDAVIAERPDAAEEAAAFCARVGTRVGLEIAALVREDPHGRRARRAARYRTVAGQRA